LGVVLSPLIALESIHEYAIHHARWLDGLTGVEAVDLALAHAVLMNNRSRFLRALLGQRLPMTQGTVMLAGPSAPISIRRDGYGVAYVDAENDGDAWFGLGFCQAQDRAFQLELRLRTVRGTLSQLVGPQTLSIDRLVRRIGFAEAARRQFDALDTDVRAQIEAFVHGINAGLATSQPAHEFALLVSQPSPWFPEDVVGMGKLLSFMLIGNWDVELTRLKLLLSDGPQALRDLDPTPYPEDEVVVSPPGSKAGAAVDALARDLEAFLAFTGRGGGSNAWAVAGSRTKSGLPVLANDPHLEAALPPHWYLARLKTPQWSVAGASMIGCAGFGAGHNGYAAWGVTASLVDTSDLFVEDVGPDGRSVRRGDGYEACEVRREVIEVRGKSPVVEEVLVTPRGPVISPALDGDLPALSLRAVWLDAKPARGFLQLHKVRTFEALRREFVRWPLLSQNVVYADVGGHIGWQLAGEPPRRRKGFGILPLHAADPETGWHDAGVPFESMPYVVDPSDGFVATANNKPAADPAPWVETPGMNGGEDSFFLGADWLDGYRAGRITEALQEDAHWDVESTMRLQMDEVSLPWPEIRDITFDLGRESGFHSGVVGESESPDLQIALALLRGWDGRVGAESVGAAVYERFLREMAGRIARARAPKAAGHALGKGFSQLLDASTFSAGRTSRLIRRLREQPEGWFERGWQAELRDALASVVRELRREHGGDGSGWGWGKIRSLTLAHPLGQVKALAPVFNRGPFPWGGDSNTVSQASGNSQTMVIASLRTTVPIGDWDAARFVLPGGQSGNPLSPLYDNMLSLWQRGEGVPIAWSDGAVENATVVKLHLIPMPERPVRP
jgi:penicillin amidase